MILATNNLGKLQEIREILKSDIKSLKEVNIDVDVEEDQETFYGNALKKAKTIYEIAKEPIIADDSGLCIKSLNNFPGIMTHRFLGDNASDENRNIALIQMLNTQFDRSASVICNLVYYDGENIVVGEGILDGNISTEIRGQNGFGFDSIFELSNGKTLAELTAYEKNKISARYLATIDLKNKLQQLSNTKKIKI